MIQIIVIMICSYVPKRWLCYCVHFLLLCKLAYFREGHHTRADNTAAHSIQRVSKYCQRLEVLTQSEEGKVAIHKVFEAGHCECMAGSLRLQLGLPTYGADSSAVPNMATFPLRQPYFSEKEAGHCDFWPRFFTRLMISYGDDWPAWLYHTATICCIAAQGDAI